MNELTENRYLLPFIIAIAYFVLLYLAGKYLK